MLRAFLGPMLFAGMVSIGLFGAMLWFAYWGAP
jgi:hypothetical protein